MRTSMRSVYVYCPFCLSFGNDKVDFITTTITITWRRQHHNHQHHHPPFHPLTRSPTRYQHDQHQHHFCFQGPTGGKALIVAELDLCVHVTSARDKHAPQQDSWHRTLHIRQTREVEGGVTTMVDTSVVIDAGHAGTQQDTATTLLADVVNTNGAHAAADVLVIQCGSPTESDDQVDDTDSDDEETTQASASRWLASSVGTAVLVANAWLQSRARCVPLCHYFYVWN
jgi:hypothetical protein